MCSKLDALATEYNHLLVSQLDSQRQYFEGLMARQQLELEQQVRKGNRGDGCAVWDRVCKRYGPFSDVEM